MTDSTQVTELPAHVQQAWIDELDHLTANGTAAWAGVDPQELREGGPRVAQAAMDELERKLAVLGAIDMLNANGWSVFAHEFRSWRAIGGFEEDFNTACDYLRYRGLLVEHGDGVVSVKERS